MWQCLPVKKIVARLICLQILLAFCAQTPTFAQANVGYNRIVSARESKGRSSITLYAEKRQTIPRPIIRFLPGQNGHTVLVADFPGLIWQLPTRVIEVNSQKSTNSNTIKRGIKLVRVGKFQESPPVCRVAIIANDLKRLKSVSFNSKPGRLSISWSKWQKNTAIAPSRAPNYKGNDIQKIATAPPFAPPISPLDPTIVSRNQERDLKLRPPIGMKAPPAKKFKPAFPEKAPPPQKKPNLISNFFNKAKRSYKRMMDPVIDPKGLEKPKTTTPANETKVAEQNKKPEIPVKEELPLIALEKLGHESFRLEIGGVQSKSLKYKTFRLHNPERYVIDVQNGDAIARQNAPVLSQNKILKGLRIGNPIVNNQKVGRIVLDLQSPETSVIAEDSAAIFYIGKTDDPLRGITTPAGSTVVIDAGHGGSDPGAQRGHTNEKDITLAIVKKTSKYLKRKGVKVVLTRDKDKSVSLANRVAITNKIRPDVFLSVHVNALESTSKIHGIETYYQTPQSLSLAKKIHKTLVDDLEAPDRRVRKARFYVVNRTTVPAVLAEVGFISNKKERKKLESAFYQNEVAGALAKGVALYLRESNFVASAPKSKKINVSKNRDKKSLSSSSKSISPGQTKKKRGTISSLSRLAQKGLGISVK